jgi:nucleoside-diphosphate-sugar epimerase
LIACVTGATGFIGSHLAERLLQLNFKVRVLIRPTSTLRWLEGLAVEKFTGNLENPEIAAGFLREADYVFHAGGAIEARGREEYFNTNGRGTRFLIEAACHEAPSLKKFIYVSSQAAGGPSQGPQGVREEDPPGPISFYGQSKLAGEKEVLKLSHKLPVVILRPPTIYGPRETRVFKAFWMLERGFALAGRKRKYISFCYIDDLIEALLSAAFRGSSNGRIYNVAGERSYEWFEFIEEMAKVLGRPYRLLRLPDFIFFLWGIGGDLYSRISGRPTFFSWQKVKDFLQSSWVIDGKRIRDELGWREKETLASGMLKTAGWCLRSGWLRSARQGQPGPRQAQAAAPN